MTWCIKESNLLIIGKVYLVSTDVLGDTACFSGNYPIPIPKWLFEEERDKHVFEV